MKVKANNTQLRNNKKLTPNLKKTNTQPVSARTLFSTNPDPETRLSSLSGFPSQLKIQIADHFPHFILDTPEEVFDVTPFAPHTCD